MYRQLKSDTYHLIASDPEKSGVAARFFDLCLMVLIIANVIAVILESVEGLFLPYADLFFAFDVFSVAVFSVEYILRLWVCTENPEYTGAITGRLHYAVTPLAIVDLVAIIPFFLPILIPFDLRFIRAIRLLRVFRLLKLGRYTYAINLVNRALFSVKEVMTIAFLVLVMLLVFSSSLMFYIEHDAQPDFFSSIPDSMWWAVATLTTVGYGDIYPITPLGKILGSLVAVLGIGMFAIPAGVLATAFIEEIRKSGIPADSREPASISPEETIALLEKLDNLRDRGIISEEEFLIQKKRILK